MNLKKNIFLAAVLLLAFISCKKSSSPSDPIPPKSTSDVYVVGSAGTIGGKAVAAYWKNGVVTKVGTDSVNGSEARAIAVNNGDVYVVGAVNGPGDFSTAAYWKNGVLTKLSNDPVNDSEGYGIALQGNDVYIIGYVFNNAGDLEGRCWKNGIMTTLPSTLSASEAIAIKSNGTDIYIAGDTRYDNKGDWTATYWKNQASPAIIAGTSGQSSEVYSIDVSGNDVYMAGYTSGNVSLGTPTYWKNGTATQLTDGSSYGTAGGIAVNGSDIIVVGFMHNKTSGYDVAMYWKNGTQVSLGDGVSNSEATGIAVDKADVYISGTINSNAVYWKNGVATTLAKSGVAMGIVVVPK